jgi:UV DNA damage endonuclease
MIRLGLCCIFKKERISFRTTTARYLSSLKKVPYEHISEIILSNIYSLDKTLEFCHAHHIGCFRITSRFFPLVTHPDWHYWIDDLPQSKALRKGLRAIKNKAQKLQIRLTFHPDQFIVLNSPNKKVVQNSIRELDYQAALSELIGADVICLHAGGMYGDKKSALSRFEKNLALLPRRVLVRLALENDDVSFSPRDLLPLAERKRLPFIYDVHHHRCLPDGLSCEEVTARALKTWGKKEPLFHISSPKNSEKRRTHHDYINISDFPKLWLLIGNITVEVEAKAKEVAIAKLIKELEKLASQ